MVFSSTIFLFLFLPVVLAAYWLTPGRWKNLVLLCGSLFFYAWGEGYYLLVMLVSMAFNWAMGLWVDGAARRGKDGGVSAKGVLALAVVGNLGLLGWFKYANFLVDSLNGLAGLQGEATLHLAPVHLPIGISFFTFQALSYVVDVYRGQEQAERHPVNVGLYIAMFPQLIAGPIVRYGHVAAQIKSRFVRLDGFALGVERFIIGLGKKMLLANPLGEVADSIVPLAFDGGLGTATAWLGAICYTLQIYYDFSGYSDMAIGLGRMFGFDFPENFKHPYIARSIREFWRRWHISLSTWFRDYLYIPLGGNRAAPWRVLANLWTVFLLCGLWHGASWNFVFWGALHGAFLVLERTRFGVFMDRLPLAVRHGYTLLVVVVAWVFFRIESFPEAWHFVGAMFGEGEAGPAWTTFLDGEKWCALALGLVCSMPLAGWLRRRADAARVGSLAEDAARYAWCMAVFLLSLSYVAMGGYNPFIYFRF